MQEKRKFNRCKLDQKSKLSTEANPDEQGLLVDVSAGGMKILLNHDVKLGSKLSGQFKISPHLGPFYIAGVVVWKKRAESGLASGWEVGIKFTKVNTIPFEITQPSG